MEKRKLKCPQCGMSNLYVTNSEGERCLISVMSDNEIVVVKEGEVLDGFDTDNIRCLGCSWSGTVRKLVRFVR